MNPFDSYMLNKVRRLKDLRTRYAATGEKALLAGVPEEDREFVTGIWLPEFERILDGEYAGDIFSKQFLSFPDTGAIPIAYKRSPNPGIVFIAV